VEIITELETRESDSVKLSNIHYQSDVDHDNPRITGVYRYGIESLSVELILKKDFTYILEFSGDIRRVELGTWRTDNNFLFLERKRFRSYFKLINNEPNPSTILTVHDIESSDWIMATYQAKYFWGTKKGLVDSTIVIPKSTKHIQLECPGYPTVGFAVNNIRGKRIEILLSRTATHFENDSFRIYPNKLVLNNSIIYNKFD
jgi:hypothetical protein